MHASPADLQRHFMEQYGLVLQPHFNSSLLALAAFGRQVQIGFHEWSSFFIHILQVMAHSAVFEDLYSIHYTGKVPGYNVGAKQPKKIKYGIIIHSLTYNT